MRHYNLTDKLVNQLHSAIETLFLTNRKTERDSPANNLPACKLTYKEKQHVASLMRINHTGEVCAQALYQGQALTAKLPYTRDKMAQAAREEIDHLAWCEQRLSELDSHTSYLNPFWYLGSFIMGAVAGSLGDRWSLGFVVETEKQVTLHLEDHLRQLNPQDEKSRAILTQMREDEMHHATIALEAGGAALPPAIKVAMAYSSKFMTVSTYYL